MHGFYLHVLRLFQFEVTMNILCCDLLFSLKIYHEHLITLLY